MDVENIYNYYYVSHDYFRLLMPDDKGSGTSCSKSDLDLTASVSIAKRKMKENNLTTNNATSQAKSMEQIRNWILSLGFGLDGSRNPSMRNSV